MSSLLRSGGLELLFDNRKAYSVDVPKDGKVSSVQGDVTASSMVQQFVPCPRWSNALERRL